MKNLSILIIILYFAPLRAQLSVIQDGEGETSLQVNNSLISFNTFNNSLDLAVPVFKNGTKRLNVSGSFQSEAGFDKFINGPREPFSLAAGVEFIKKSNDIALGKIRHFFFGGELLFTRTTLYDPLLDSHNVYSDTNIGFKGNIGYNQLNSFLGVFSLGTSLSGGIDNNSAALELQDILTGYLSPQAGVTAGDESSTVNAYYASAFKKTNGFAKFNVDFGHQLFRGRVFANLHGTYGIRQEVKPSFTSSLGLYYMKDGAPLEAVLGLQLQTSDWFDNKNSGLSNWERTALVITVGFPFD